MPHAGHLTGGIRMADGTGRAVRQPRHPDPLVEAYRWSLTEAAVVQAIGRCRGVRRIRRAGPGHDPGGDGATAGGGGGDDVGRGAARPDPGGGGRGEPSRPLSAAPGDLHQARPDLFKNEKAAALVLERQKYLKLL